jgi:H+-transporting ATPase
MNQVELLRLGALAAKWKEPARDALDTLVLNAVDLPYLDQFEQIDFMPFDPTIKRTEGTLKGPDGKVFKTTKGAPHIIVKLCKDPTVAAQVEKKVRRGCRSCRRGAGGRPAMMPCQAPRPAASLAPCACALRPAPSPSPLRPRQVHELGTRGIRSLAVAKSGDSGEWEMQGILTFLDPPRPDTKETIEQAMAFGVDVKMITGARLRAAGWARQPGR